MTVTGMNKNMVFGFVKRPTVLKKDAVMLRQIADVTGVYGVSFVVVLGNASIAALSHALFEWLRTSPASSARNSSSHIMRGAIAPTLIFAVALTSCLGYGVLRIPSDAVRSEVYQERLDEILSVGAGVDEGAAGLTEAGQSVLNVWEKMDAGAITDTTEAFDEADRSVRERHALEPEGRSGLP